MSRDKGLRVADWNGPDDPIGPGAMVSEGRLYPFDANVAQALATSAMMLEDRSELSLRLGQEANKRWEREHGWKHYRYLDSGEYLRWDGLVIHCVWQEEIERGDWPPPGAKPTPPWPPPPGTPNLEQAAAELNRCREQAGLRYVTPYRLSREQLDLLWEAFERTRPRPEDI